MSLPKERWNPNWIFQNKSQATSQPSNFLKHINLEMSTRGSCKNWNEGILKCHSTSFRRQLIWLNRLKQNPLSWIRRSSSIRENFLLWRMRIKGCNLKMTSSSDRVCMRCRNNSRMMGSWRYSSRKSKSYRSSSRLSRRRTYPWQRRMKRCWLNWQPKMLR